MDSIQVFKIFLYTFLDLIPCLVLALTPFKERFRFSFLKTHLLLPLLFLMVFISRVLTMQGLSIAHFFTVFMGSSVSCLICGLRKDSCLYTTLCFADNLKLWKF